MRTLSSLALTAALLAVAPANAVTIELFDDFSSYGPNTVENAGDLVFAGNWTTTSGTVDYLAAGSTYSELCPAGTNCIDLDGSSNAGGTFVSRVFGPGIYNVLFQLGGNARNDVLDMLTITFGDISRSVAVGRNGVVNQLTFGTDFMGIVVGSGGTSLSFSVNSNDNQGPLLKSVVIESVPAPVPVPAAGGLLLAALGAMGLLRRRKA